MNTAELTGAELDYWVAKAEGLEPVAGRDFPSGAFSWQPTVGTGLNSKDLRFSASWAIGGLIIEREVLNITAGGSESRWKAWSGKGISAAFVGDTALTAAMRAYVAKKFGNEVPDLN